MRRNATALYHPRKLTEMHELAPLIDDWTVYINRILTNDVIQVGLN